MLTTTPTVLCSHARIVLVLRYVPQTKKNSPENSRLQTLLAVGLLCALRATGSPEQELQAVYVCALYAGAPLVSVRACDGSSFCLQVLHSRLTHRVQHRWAWSRMHKCRAVWPNSQLAASHRSCLVHDTRCRAVTLHRYALRLGEVGMAHSAHGWRAGL